ncbi:hypothetical protein ACN47E_009336 [Coniothyrium glycines]
MARLFLFSLLPIFVSATLGQKCYGLDGTELDSTYAPCNPDAKNSGCCATRRTDASPDICLDNGLCMATNDELMGTIWQSGCTDATGKDAACPRMCPDMNNNFNGLTAVSAWNIQTCDYGKYCCRAINDKRSCCNNATAPRITTTFVGAFQASATLGSTSAIPTQVLATDVSIAPSTDATVKPNIDLCKKARHDTAIVGGTLAVISSLVILGLSGVIFWMHKKEIRQRKLKEHYEEQFSQTNAYRKALASSAGSTRGSMMMEEFRPKSKGGME